MKEELTHGSLFSGIGGFELGAFNVGIETLWGVEKDKFCRAVLKKNFPQTKLYKDISKVKYLKYVDIISGGFPCQDISIAKQNAEGINGERSGLWAEMLRIIRVVRPKYIIIENSPMLLIRGFSRILWELAQIRYDAEWQCLSARQFGFNHKRERLYCIAYHTGGDRRTKKDDEASIFSKKIPQAQGRESCRAISRAVRHEDNGRILRNDDGLPSSVDRIKSCGNAIIPAISAYLFSCIKTDFEKKKNNYAV